MLKIRLFRRWKEVLFGLAALMVMVGTSNAAVYNLRADVTTKTMPDGSVIPMWGFADDTAGPGVVTVPGPVLTVAATDPVLQINLTNKLPVPISVVIPGQAIGAAPTYVGGRVISFTAEAPAGGTATYSWTLKPGTYIYQSGTNPAVQVQMGLYGAVVKDFATGQAYNSSASVYDSEVILFFSAIDPDIHHSVATGNYTGIGAQTFSGYTPPAILKTLTSTIDYWPRYFLVNGEPYSAASSPLPAGNLGEATLIRILNAGLQTYVPTLLGSHVSLIAEDGNLYPYPKEQYSLVLAAGKTMDAIFTPQLPGTYPVFDRRLNVTNAGVSPGGMIAKLSVGGTVGAPTAVGDSYTVAAGGTLVLAAPGVLGNDTGTGPFTALLDSGPANGTLTLNLDGSFTYTPNTGFSGDDTFQYRANNAGGPSFPATVTITVISNSAPVAINQSVATNEDTAKAITLAATDANGDALTYSVVTSPAHGTLSGMAPNVTYTPAANYFGADSFTFKANDGLADSNVATVSITVNSVNDAPVALDDTASTTRNTPVTINLIANDSDIDGTINPASVAITTAPTRGGTVTNNLNGTVIFTPKRNFRGTDVFRYTVRDYDGALSNVATVRVNVN
jgi:FtsP/CotA-like multicopper oxidase with cupredoxin domain